jgi:glycosyltransferase involved in cell wall biosynthesis
MASESAMTAPQPLRVLMVLNSLAPGGTEQSTVLLAPPLRECGIDVSIVTLRPAPHELYDLAVANGIDVIRLAPGGFVSQLRQLRSLIRARAPLVVHTALFDADVMGRLAAVGTGSPVVSSFVSTPYDSARLADPNVHRLKLRTVQAIDAITGRFLVDRFHSVSDGAMVANARALRIPSDRISVAERGRDTSALGQRTPERRAVARRGLGIDDETPVVVNLGRLEYQKGQVDLVRAMSIVRRDHPSAILLIAGKDGSATPAVRQALSDDTDTAQHVRLLGHRTDVGDLLVAADVLAISSLFEGTAGVALEAMALGTPIVSTDLDGLRGVLRHDDTALLVERSNPDALAKGISRVLADSQLSSRLAERALADFDARFTLSAAAKKLADLYRSVAR